MAEAQRPPTKASLFCWNQDFWLLVLSFSSRDIVIMRVDVGVKKMDFETSSKHP